MLEFKTLRRYTVYKCKQNIMIGGNENEAIKEDVVDGIVIGNGDEY